MAYSDEWSTPNDLFLMLDKKIHFDLDPCASSYNHKCPFYFTKEDDGLSMCWVGCTVFCNPPYSNIKEWVKKCYTEFKCNDTKIVLLIPARTDTSYFHDYILGTAEIRFIRGRLRFNNSNQNAPFPSVLCFYGVDPNVYDSKYHFINRSSYSDSQSSSRYSGD